MCGVCAGNKLDNARELRKVVYFSNVVLAPLVAATKGGSAEDKKEAAMQEMATLMAEARKKEEEEEKEGAAAPSGTPSASNQGAALPRKFRDFSGFFVFCMFWVNRIVFFVVQATTQTQSRQWTEQWTT